MKLKISMSYPPSGNNFEHYMPCKPCRTLEASFLEDLVPPSKLVCHIPLQLITYSQEQVIYKFLATRIYKFIFCSWAPPLHKMAANLTILNNRFFSFWIIARIQKLLQSQKMH